MRDERQADRELGGEWMPNEDPRPSKPSYTHAEALSGSYFEGRSYVELTEDVIAAAKAAWLNDFGVPRHSSAYAYLCDLFSLEVLA